MCSNPEYNYTFYNISFSPEIKPKKDLDAIKKADIIIIPTEQEFHFHTPNYFHPKTLEKSNNDVLSTLPYIADKHVVILRFDRADNEELFRTKTFKGINISKFDQIDEDDWSCGVHMLKYHYIRDNQNLSLFTDYKNKKYDFSYWGSLKNKDIDGKNSGDIRHKILRGISKQSDLNCYWIGRYIGMQRDMKMSKMKDILPFLRSSGSTLCFNWKDPNALTARYNEAMATYQVPLVWENYDCTNRLVANEWQRCYSVEDVSKKIKECRDPNVFDEIYSTYKQKILNKNEIYNIFNSKLNSIINY
jgi:hypothetical protein